MRRRASAKNCDMKMLSIALRPFGAITLQDKRKSLCVRKGLCVFVGKAVSFFYHLTHHKIMQFENSRVATSQR